RFMGAVVLERKLFGRLVQGKMPGPAKFASFLNDAGLNVAVHAREFGCPVKFSLMNGRESRQRIFKARELLGASKINVMAHEPLLSISLNRLVRHVEATRQLIDRDRTPPGILRRKLQFLAERLHQIHKVRDQSLTDER